ncbi:MAG: ABC transporter permease subunit [Chthoniobacterales bacterium]
MNPLSLLHLEWKKISTNGTFRILALFYVVFYALSVYLTFLIGQHTTFSFQSATMNPAGDLFTFPRLWELVAYIGSWLNLLVLGLMGVFLMTIELTNRTIRQNVISGLSRTEVFVGKISIALAIAAVATCCYLLLGATCGGLTSQSLSAATLPPWDGVVRYFIQSTGYLLLGLLIGLFIRQTALATIVYLIFFFLEFVFSRILYWTIWKNDAVFLLPSHVLNSLIPVPVPKMVYQLIGSQNLVGSAFPLEIWIFAAAYLALFAGLLFYRLRKIDL